MQIFVPFFTLFSETAFGGEKDSPIRRKAPTKAVGLYSQKLRRRLRRVRTSSPNAFAPGGNNSAAARRRRARAKTVNRNLDLNFAQPTFANNKPKITWVSFAI